MSQPLASCGASGCETTIELLQRERNQAWKQIANLEAQLALAREALQRTHVQLMKSELFIGYGDGPLREPATKRALELAITALTPLTPPERTE